MDCLYIFGEAGTGKTTACKRALNYIRRQHGIDYYTKMGGISRFFDGYDWEPICLIDDPIPPDQNSTPKRAAKKLTCGESLLYLQGG